MKDINDVFEDDANLTEVELDEVKVDSKGTAADISEDYNFVRENLIRSIVRGSELIDESVREAKTAPSARAIEAASGAVKTLTEASKSLLDLHEKIRNIEKEKPTDEIQGGCALNGDKIVLKSTLTDLIKQIDQEDQVSNQK